MTMKKGGLAIMIGSGKPMLDKEPEDDEMDDSDSFDMLAEQAFTAIKDDDMDAFKEAFRSAVYQCCSEYGGDED